MSATRDKNQRFTFLYSNLYQIYRREKGAASAPASKLAPPNPVNPNALSGQVLKVGELKAGVEVRPYQPAEIIGRRVEKPEFLQGRNVAPAAAAIAPANPTVESLKENLQKLTDLHSRLKFMLQELEELVEE
ncbi:MAG: hypothetical protein AB7P04_04640 [Bacteriovoracia bacterium]